jgi:AcrR family transcriptional regulator
MASKPRRKRKGAYHHGDLERALVEAALRTIRLEGVQGLTLRGVGAQLGVSRTALYRHFEDKAALVARVALEGFTLFHDALSAAIARAARENGDPLEEMARAYVRFAMANQSHYQTMFGGFLTDWNRYPDLMQRAEATFQLLVDAVRDEQRERRLVAGDPVELAEVFWSLSHGISTLGAQHLARTRPASRTSPCSGAGPREDTMMRGSQTFRTPNETLRCS